MTLEQDASQTTSTIHENEIAELEALVAEVERAQQHELVDEYVGLFRSDAIWTTGSWQAIDRP